VERVAIRLKRRYVSSADGVGFREERKAVDLGSHIGFSQNLLTAGWLAN
jgi:hypothetical protein